MSELCRTMYILKKWFEASGMTYEEFASKVGVNRTTIWRWFNGKQVPDIYHVERMMEIFDLSHITIR